jgi:hypothetical protein
MNDMRIQEGISDNLRAEVIVMSGCGGPELGVYRSMVTVNEAE